MTTQTDTRVILELSEYDQEMLIYVLTHGWSINDQQIRDWIKSTLVRVDPEMESIVYGSANGYR